MIHARWRMSQLGSLRLLAWSVAHTRWSQLAHRAFLTLRRRLLVAAYRRGAAPIAWLTRPAPRVRAELPHPLFTPHAGPEPAAAVVSLAGHSYPICPPVDWEAAALGTRLEKLQLHSMEYLEAVDDALFRDLVEDWLGRNPPYGKEYWKGVWNSYAVSIRCTVWVQQLGRADRRLPAELRERMFQSIAAQTRFLERNLERDIGGNHLVRNARALLHAGACFIGAESDRWTGLGRSILAGDVGEQILPDGTHFELSPAYHAQVLADLLECHALLPEGPLREQATESLQRMGQVLADLTHPDGSISLFNDGGLHMTHAPREILDLLERLTASRPVPRPVFALRDGGYFGCRSGGDYVLCDAGRIAPDHLPAHGHGDALAFEWTLGGRRIVVDAGVFEYYPGARRTYSRATASHNTLTLDGLDQAEFWGSFRMARRPNVRVLEYRSTEDGFVLVGSHDGFAHLSGRPEHVRRFAVHPREIQVCDEVRGGAGQLAEAGLLLHPECTVELEPRGARIRQGPVQVLLESDAPVRIVPAQWHPDFGVERATQRLVLDYGPAPCVGGFVLSGS